MENYIQWVAIWKDNVELEKFAVKILIDYYNLLLKLFSINKLNNTQLEEIL